VDKAGTKTTSHVGRVERLEIIERKRLERVEADARSRVQRLNQSLESIGPREKKLLAVERYIRFPMGAIGIAWLVMMIDDATTPHPANWVRWVIIALWGAVVVEYLLRLMFATQVKHYMAMRLCEPLRTGERFC
jgi:hypothetical protein